MQNKLIRIIMMVLTVMAFNCGTSDEAPANKDTQLYTCGMDPQVIQEGPGICPICNMKLTPLKQETSKAVEHQEHDLGAESPHGDPADSERRILYWRAPMDASYISDKPGKSPMGMDLIPVYEGEEVSSRAAISIDPVTVQNMGVRTAVIKRQEFSQTIRSVGHIDYNEETLSLVNLKFDGWIEQLFVNKTGEFVEAGQPLFSIYSPQLVTTQEEYLLAWQSHQKLSGSSIAEVGSSAKSLLDASRRRLQYWDISDKQIQELEDSGKIKKSLTIYAPSSGVVEHKNAIEGARVMAGQNLFSIANLDKIWVLAHIFEYELPWIKRGQTAEMELPYIPGKQFTGKVDYIYPYLDAKSRDVKIRLVFDNPDYELKPQMYANVTISAQFERQQVVVPSEAVIRTGVRNTVFLVAGAGKFQPRDIILGPEGQDGLIAVVSGLSEGDVIVTSAQFLLDSESRLREAIQKMLDSRMAKE